MKRYADDYEVVIKEDENGNETKKVVYRGAYFDINLDKPGLRKYQRDCLLLLAAIIALDVGAGFSSSRGMYQFYVVLPYVITFLALYYLAAGILRLPDKTQNLRHDEADLSFNRINKASSFLLVLLGITVIGEVVFLLFFTSLGNIEELYFLGLEAPAVILAYLLFRNQKAVNIQEISDKSNK